MDMKNKNEEQRYEIPVAQKALIYDEKTKKFLLLKASHPQKCFLEHYGEWEFPGGKLEDNETLEAGLEREIREEVGNIDFEVEFPISVKKIRLNSGNMIMIDYAVLYKGGELELSEEHKELRWETAEEVEKNGDYHDWVKKLVKKAAARIKEKEYLEGWRRCQADFENYKKRQLEMKKDIISFANENIITEILPVLDNFYASTEHIPQDQKESPWVTGIGYIQRQLEQVLENNNVEEIKIKEGDKFDPNVMEAISDSNMRMESESANKENIVKKIVVRGYKLGEKIIRPAKVIAE